MKPPKLKIKMSYSLTTAMHVVHAKCFNFAWWWSGSGTRSSVSSIYTSRSTFMTFSHLWIRSRFKRIIICTESKRKINCNNIMKGCVSLSNNTSVICTIFGSFYEWYWQPKTYIPWRSTSNVESVYRVCRKAFHYKPKLSPSSFKRSKILLPLFIIPFLSCGHNTMNTFVWIFHRYSQQREINRS